MTLNLLCEAELRKRADQPTIRMLDLWNSLCLERIGSPIEVMICDRREYPFHGISTHNGKLNTSVPQSWQDKVILALLLESGKKSDMIIVTHELGHWVLRLQGFKVLVNVNDRKMHSEDRYGELSSLCTHPALYILQRRLGLDPQKEIDKRTAHDIAFLLRKTETNDEKTNTEAALYYADDLLNCSRSNRIGLERRLSNKLPKTAKIVEEILEIKAPLDLSKIEDVLLFSKEIVHNLSLSGNWRESNDLECLKEQVAETRLKYKSE